MTFEVYNFRSLNSTNIKAKRFAKKGYSSFVVVADRQTRGRGRLRRKWASGLGGLYMTIVLVDRNLDNVKHLTFIASISVVKAIKKLANLNAKVKWPNDVLIGRKKVCGILTETLSRGNFVFVGIGVNVNQNRFSKSMRLAPTSLFLETGNKYDIKKLLEEIMKNFNAYYNYYNKENYKKIINDWKKLSYTLGKKVKAETTGKIYAGKVVGIDKDCNLLLKCNGEVIKIVEGDISVI
jgi:BirA family transcriptional regulator, biotin operon repressor / biotin---[acetyl-CoA-carboxylase] ligase